jgi:CRP-like cAMP-binding protein
MAPSLPKRSSSSPPESLGSRTSDLPVDHALSLLLADEAEPALRWSAAALERDPWSPSAIIVTSRVLSQMGRSRAAVDGLLLAVQRATESGDLPLAIVAIDQLRGLGVKVGEALDDVASAFCRDSGRLHAKPVPQANSGDFQPLSPLLTGDPLASKAAQILLAAKHAVADPSTDLAAVAPLPLFSALSREPLREFLEALETTFVPSGHRLLQEGKDSGAAFIVATGSLEISRRAAEGASRVRTVLGRVGPGALVGEVALMSHLPSAASVTATTASILLVARRGAIEPVASRHAELGIELAAFCRRHAVANLGWASTLVAAVPAAERASLVERLETRTFERGEKLVAHGEETQGLHLIVSGEVAVVAREGGGRVMLATRVAGETVGEIELVLCQKANVDAIAVRSTATLLLPPEEFFALVRESPATLHGLYAIAVRRHAELRNALEAGSAMNSDDWALDDESGEHLPSGDRSSANQLGEGGLTANRGTPPPPLPREAALPTPTPPPVGTYDALNGSAFRSSAAPRSTAPQAPFSPAASFAPGSYAAQPTAGGNGQFVAQAVSHAPASFIPPAPAAPLPPFAATQPSSYPPPSPFTPPPNVTAQQAMQHGPSVPTSVASAGSPQGSHVGATMVLAGLVTAAAIVLLTMTVLGKRPSDFVGSAPAAEHPAAAAPGMGAAGAENVSAGPAPAATAAVSGPAPLTTHAPVVVPVTRVTKAPAPRSSEGVAASPRVETSSSTTPVTSATMTAATTAMPVSSVATPAQVTAPASASSDEFGGRQ